MTKAINQDQPVRKFVASVLTKPGPSAMWSVIIRGRTPREAEDRYRLLHPEALMVITRLILEE